MRKGRANESCRRAALNSWLAPDDWKMGIMNPMHGKMCCLRADSRGANQSLERPSLALHPRLRRVQARAAARLGRYKVTN